MKRSALFCSQPVSASEGNGGAGAGPAEARPVPGSRDFATKILHMAWHPKEHVLACAASNSLYVFNA